MGSSLYQPLAVEELNGVPARDQQAITNAMQKPGGLGPKALPHPHSSAVWVLTDCANCGLELVAVHGVRSTGNSATLSSSPRSDPRRTTGADLTVLLMMPRPE